MPVRFRCHHCNQLLGIARRKIGMDVKCPTCHNNVLVPPRDAPDVDQPTIKKDPLFEGSDLDALLKPGMAEQPFAAPNPAPPAWPQPGAPGNVETYNPPGPLAASAPAAGVILSPIQATLFTVGLVLLLAAVFAAGLLIGRFCFGP